MGERMGRAADEVLESLWGEDTCLYQLVRELAVRSGLEGIVLKLFGCRLHFLMELEA